MRRKVPSGKRRLHKRLARQAHRLPLARCVGSAGLSRAVGRRCLGSCRSRCRRRTLFGCLGLACSAQGLPIVCSGVSQGGPRQGIEPDGAQQLLGLVEIPDFQCLEQPRRHLRRRVSVRTTFAHPGVQPHALAQRRGKQGLDQFGRRQHQLVLILLAHQELRGLVGLDGDCLCSGDLQHAKEFAPLQIQGGSGNFQCCPNELVHFGTRAQAVGQCVAHAHARHENACAAEVRRQVAPARDHDLGHWVGCDFSGRDLDQLLRQVAQICRSTELHRSIERCHLQGRSRGCGPGVPESLLLRELREDAPNGWPVARSCRVQRELQVATEPRRVRVWSRQRSAQIRKALQGLVQASASLSARFARRFPPMSLGQVHEKWSSPLSLSPRGPSEARDTGASHHVEERTPRDEAG